MSPSQGECSGSDSHRPLTKNTEFSLNILLAICYSQRDMKLYLSSFRLGDLPEQFAGLFGENKRVAIIPNAKDNYGDLHREQRILEEVEALTAIGLQPEIIDLRNFFQQKERLPEALNAFGGAWVVGGNTFVLRVAMKESGFDEWVKTKITDKNFVYGGYSAGICVLSPTLKGLNIKDNPEEVPEVYKKDIIWEGIGILDYSIAPHYRSDHPESGSVEKEVEYWTANHMPYKTLHDGEVVIAEI